MDTISYIHLRSGDHFPVLSLSPFKAIIVAEEAVDADWRSKAAEWLVRSGCLYLVAWGNACEAWHDDVDSANIAAFEGGYIPVERFIMTTWHEREPLSEALWFAAVNVDHPRIELTTMIIVHVAQHERASELLEQYRAAANE